MKKLVKHIISSIVIAFCALPYFPTYANSDFEPMSRIDFWRNYFPVISASDSSLVAKAELIFHRVLKAAGQRYGTQPQLLVVDTGKRQTELPIAIPDGWIIISNSMLETLSGNAHSFDNHLAFIFGHEIAHQLEDDFWNVKFFNAVKAFQGQVNPEMANAIGGLKINNEELMNKELKADEKGIVYMAMAGFDANQLFDKQGGTDFFTQWLPKLYPKLDKDTSQAATHPVLMQREGAVKARLFQVHSHANLFQMGTWFYYSGQFEKAASLFSEFVSYFPEKSAHLNLAASYHQLAIRHHKPLQSTAHLPFNMSFELDPFSNARLSIFRALNMEQKTYEYYRDRAIQYYNMAIAQDPNYVTAMNNLACIAVLDGNPFQAIALLQNALRNQPDSPRLLNNLAIAFFESGLEEKAHDHFKKSLQVDPHFSNTHLNLGLLAIKTKNESMAKRHWKQYLESGRSDDWSKVLVEHYDLGKDFLLLEQNRSRPSRLEETIENVTVGTFLEELPPTWQSQRVNALIINDTVHKYIEYANGISAISEAGELRVLVATPQFASDSRRHIKKGDMLEQVYNAYGQPSHVFESVLGKALMYGQAGISFILVNDKVTSWILF